LTSIQADDCPIVNDFLQLVELNTQVTSFQADNGMQRVQNSEVGATRTLFPPFSFLVKAFKLHLTLINFYKLSLQLPPTRREAASEIKQITITAGTVHEYPHFERLTFAMTGLTSIGFFSKLAAYPSGSASRASKSTGTTLLFLPDSVTTCPSDALEASLGTPSLCPF
jgi:hypothetical protein